MKVVLITLGIMGIAGNAFGMFNQFQQGNNCGQQGNCGNRFPQFGGNCGQQPCPYPPQQNPFLPQNPQYGAMYQASTTTTTTPSAVTPCPTPAPVIQYCLQVAADRICALTCSIGTYTVAVPDFSCEGSGVGAVCCRQP